MSRGMTLYTYLLMDALEIWKKLLVARPPALYYGDKLVYRKLSCF